MDLLKKLNPINERFEAVETSFGDDFKKYRSVMLTSLGKSVLRGGLVGAGIGSVVYLLTGMEESLLFGALFFSNVDMGTNALRTVGLTSMRKRNIGEYETHKERSLSRYNS